MHGVVRQREVMLEDPYRQDREQHDEDGRAPRLQPVHELVAVDADHALNGQHDRAPTQNGTRAAACAASPPNSPTSASQATDDSHCTVPGKMMAFPNGSRASGTWPVPSSVPTCTTWPPAQTR